jgi:transposase
MASVEVITSVERRRRWSRDEKLRVVAESAQAGRTASQVARDHGIAPGQLFIWRRQFLSQALASSAGEHGFVPVEIAHEASAVGARTAPKGGGWPIEIRLANGVVIGVGSDVEVEPLRRVLTALAGR